MAATGWYSDNEQRAYPFVRIRNPVQPAEDYSSSAGVGYYGPLDTLLLVDFGAVLGAGTDYDEAEGHVVYLASAGLSGDGLTITLVFRTSAPGTSAAITFTYQKDLEEHTTIWGEAADETPTCDDEPSWSAFIVVGQPSRIGGFLEPGETAVYHPRLHRIEPARVQSLRGAYVRGITVVNRARTRAEPPSECGSLGAQSEYYVARECVRGEVVCREGYNASLRQDAHDNAMVLGAAVGAGLGEPCEEIPLYEGEASPDGGLLLSGGPACSEVVRSINGVPGPDLTIRAGRGFRVVPATYDEHGLEISLVATDLGVCPADSEGA